MRQRKGNGSVSRILRLDSSFQITAYKTVGSVERVGFPMVPQDRRSLPVRRYGVGRVSGFRTDFKPLTKGTV